MTEQTQNRKLILEQITEDKDALISAASNQDHVYVATTQIGGPEGSFLPRNRLIGVCKRQSGPQFIQGYQFTKEIIACEPDKTAPIYLACMETGKMLHTIPAGERQQLTPLFYSDGTSSVAVRVDDIFRDIITSQDYTVKSNKKFAKKLGIDDEFKDLSYIAVTKHEAYGVQLKKRNKYLAEEAIFSFDGRFQAKIDWDSNPIFIDGKLYTSGSEKGTEQELVEVNSGKRCPFAKIMSQGQVIGVGSFSHNTSSPHRNLIAFSFGEIPQKEDTSRKDKLTLTDLRTGAKFEAGGYIPEQTRRNIGYGTIYESNSQRAVAFSEEGWWLNIQNGRLIESEFTRIGSRTCPTPTRDYHFDFATGKELPGIRFTMHGQDFFLGYRTGDHERACEMQIRYGDTPGKSRFVMQGQIYATKNASLGNDVIFFGGDPLGGKISIYRGSNLSSETCSAAVIRTFPKDQITVKQYEDLQHGGN
jgi:hypothetical protein